MNKVCYECGMNKSIDSFRKCSSSKDGHQLYCKECRKPYERKYYKKNREKIINTTKEWIKENPAKFKQHMKNNRKKPFSKIKTNLRKRIKEILGYKDASVSQSLGCTPKEFRIYIESLFKPGMSWENYGEWHMDHKRPLASFKLESKEEQKKANHYTNLQPLWAKENIEKGAKYEF